MSGSVSSSSATGGFTNTLRFTGMASGLDVDSIVKQLMDAEKMPYTKLQQKQQVEQWTMDAYRDMTTQMKGLQSSFMDSLTPTTNMLSSNIYKQFSNTVTSAVLNTPASVSVTTNSDASVGNHSITVTSMATTAKVTSSSPIGAGEGTYISSPLVIAAASNNNILNLSFDGTNNISLSLADGSYDLSNSQDSGTFINDLQSKINGAFGAGKINVNLVNEKDASGNSKFRIMFNAVDPSKDINIGAGNGNAALGLSDNSVIKTVSDSTTLSALATKLSSSPSSTLNLNINGNNVFTADLDISGADGGLTVSDFINKVNTSSAATTAGVVMSYDTLTGKFKFESKNTGTTTSITIKDSSANSPANTNTWLQKLGIASDANGVNICGKDAVVTVDGITLSSQQNSVLQNGVSYNLINIGTSNVIISNNIDSAVATIKNFIDKYNTLIANINTKLTDKYDSSYQPLTDDQKASMKDADITNWNTKAQTGLLHGDNILKSIVDGMRAALSDSVPGTNQTLHLLGIDTSDDWTQNGKLTMPDDTKLRSALQNDPDGVVKLFTAVSSVSYNPGTNTPAQVQQRYSENGLIQRINDIINNAARTTNGKGDLLLKAGMINDTTQYDNNIYNEMQEDSTQLNDMKQMLTDKENSYYTKFSDLETYMNNMNNQSSWLTQQISKM